MKVNESTEQINWFTLLHTHTHQGDYNFFSHLDAMDLNDIALPGGGGYSL